MRIKIMKFGGTSVTPEARMTAAQRVVSARDQGWDPVVVVSAMGRRGMPYATDTLIGLLREVDEVTAPDPREMDLMIACGEILSAVIFAHTLKCLGHAAQAFRGGQAGIRTDGVYGNARITSINPVSLLRALESGQIPVVCGFQGVYVAGDGAPGAELTTLGRGGSDTTAAAIGAAIRAEAVEIFTDVDGVKTADPSIVPGAPTLARVAYEEVAEIAHLGAKVLHPRAAEIAMKFGVSLWVKNTFSDAPGTEVVATSAGRGMTGVTHTGKLVYLEFRLGGLETGLHSGIQARIFRTLADYGLNLYMTNLAPSGFGFALPREQFPVAENLLDGLVLPVDGGFALVQLGDKPSKEAAAQARLLRESGSLLLVPVALNEGCAMVSVIGREDIMRPGVFARVLRTLHEAQVAVLQTSDSDLSLSCLIPEAEVDRAVRLLHDAFGLST
jgi:aspartate kinase